MSFFVCNFESALFIEFESGFSFSFIISVIFLLACLLADLIIDKIIHHLIILDFTDRLSSNFLKVRP